MALGLVGVLPGSCGVLALRPYSKTINNCNDSKQMPNKVPVILEIEPLVF